jgi:peptidoglycan/xylan/chitin deacetylase (PgdA/CDA1 family)
MRLSFLIFIALNLFFGFSPGQILSAENTVREGSGATILIYHRFGEDKYPSTNVDVDRFHEQLEFLRENNYQVIPLERLISALNEDRSELPERGVVITIDDGYRSVYTKAWPLLQQYGYPFTVFIYAKAVENKHRNYLTWEQVREMEASGVDIQNHGYGHDHMAFAPSGMSADEYRSWIRTDLDASTRILSDELKNRPRFFAVPYGEYNSTVLDEIRSFGYQGILLQDPGSISKDTDPFALPREPILGNEWASMAHFKKVLERVDLPLQDEIPEAGLLQTDKPEIIGATLLYPDRYVPGTLGIYVSELGWQKATLEGAFVSISNSTPLKRTVNRVAVSGREKKSGRTAIRYWMLTGQ